MKNRMKAPLQGDLRAQMEQLARQIDALKCDLNRALDRIQSETSRQLTAAAVREIVETRRLKACFLPQISFADPAWDMILHLTAARLESEAVTITDLCVASNVPYTTALRWIAKLENAGLFERRDDTADGRRVLIELTDAALDTVQQWYGACAPVTIVPFRPPAGV